MSAHQAASAVAPPATRLREREGALGAWAGRSDLPGINLYGHTTQMTGMATGALGFAASLAAAGLNHALIDINRPPEASSRPIHPINFVASNPWVMGDGRYWRPQGGLDRDTFLRGYNIAYWAWESAFTAPVGWASVLPVFDEVWVPSRFTAEALARTMSLAATVVPHAIDVGYPVVNGGIIDVPPDTTVFCFVFDGLSGAPRKNPAAVVRAFCRAFPTGGAALVIKSRNLSGAMLDDLVQAGAGHPGIHIRLGGDSRAAVLALMARADAYISLHRSEGFGLTIAEAMALGKPVIATAYSGNLDFMDEKTSFPVGYRLVATTEDDINFPAGTIWADPDIEHAAAVMRFVRDNPTVARARGHAAAHFIRQHYSPAAIGGAIRDRLQAAVTGAR